MRKRRELTELPELAVANDESAECAKTIESLVTVLLCGILVYWCIGNGCVATGDLLGLPDEILKEVALVLGEEKDLGLLDNITKIRDKLLALCGELL